MTDEWFYRRDGQQFGPVSSRKLLRLVLRGEVGADDMLWREGMPGWRRAGDSKTLFGTAADREKRMQRRRPASARSRRPARAEATANPEAAEWIGRRPLLVSIGIGVGAGTLISAVVAAVLLSVDTTAWEEDAVPPPAQPAPETPVPETPAPETPAPETPEPETPEPETPEPETRDPEMLDLDKLDPEIPGLNDATRRLRKRRSSF